MSTTVNDDRFPNRQRDAYPAGSVPRLVVDDPPDLSLLRVTDTTFRDGQQAREPFTVEDVARLHDLLARLDGGSGRIAQAEFFLYGERDRAALEACREQDHAFPEATAWIRAVADDLVLVRAAGLAETGILCSASDHHIAAKLGLTRREAFDRYLGLARAAVEAGIRPRCHLEDVTRADLDGFVLPFVEALVALEQDSGVPVKVRLCDTLGLGLPWAEAAAPRSVPRLVRALRHAAGIAPERLEWHGHDDLGKAHANSVAAWLAGCAAVNATLGGIGERTGNSPLELAALELVSLTGDERVDLRVLGELPAALAATGVDVPPGRPLLGREAFLTRAGVHIDGLLKDPEVYLPFDTAAVLGRPYEVAVNDRSGAAGVAWALGRGKRDPLVQRLAAEVAAEFAAGRTRDVAPEELVRRAEALAPAG